MEMKKLVMLGQYKLHMKPTNSLLQDSTMSNVLIFCLLYCNLKEKDHVRRIIKSQKKKGNINM